jgi:glucose-6-phosphate isomerase
MSNFFAQPDALAYGKTVAELQAEDVPAKLFAHKEFPGNRPSFSLLLPEMNAFTCGQLLAIYEHREAVQGWIWGINSFDQWGVELGKVLANKVRSTLSAARAAGDEVAISGYNPSTSILLKKYISGGK